MGKRDRDLRESGLANSALAETMGEFEEDAKAMLARLKDLASSRAPINWRELEATLESFNKLQERCEQHNFYNGHDDPKHEGAEYTPGYDRELTKTAREKWIAHSKNA